MICYLEIKVYGGFLMIEEIITNNLPEEKKVTYTSDGVYNIVTNRIVKISDNKTNSTNNRFYSLVIINWIGRIYKNSNYFSKPEEEKMLLVCNTGNDIFYIS